ncbi:unnamed protein product, partial [Didymodactylos carnosus]
KAPTVAPPICPAFVTAQTSCLALSPVCNGVCKASLTTVATGLNNIYDITTNSGYVYVVNANKGNVEKFRLDNTPSSKTTPTVVASNLVNPWGVYVTSDAVYVSDTFNHQIKRYPTGANPATGGTVVAGGNGSGSAQNQLSYPYGLFVDCAGNIYIADSHNNRIVRWAPNAKTGCTVAGKPGGKAGNALTELNFPIDVRFDNQGNMFVVDSNNYRVLKYVPGSSTGIVVAGNGQKVNGFNTAIGFYVDACDTVYLGATRGVIKFPPGTNGTGIPVIESGYTGGIAVDNKGTLFIGSRGGNVVQTCTLSSGTQVTQPPTSKTNIDLSS